MLFSYKYEHCINLYIERVPTQEQDITLLLAEVYIIFI